MPITYTPRRVALLRGRFALPGDALRARPDATVPERFKPSPGPGLPTDRKAEAERLIAALEATADEYAARLDARVRELAAND